MFKLQGFNSITVKIEGVAPLLMSNRQLADPRNPITKAIKEITAKRKRTDDDLLRLSELQFRGGLYSSVDGKPCLPARVLEAAFHNGAKCKRKGAQFKIGCFVQDDAPLQYKGPKDADGLWADSKFVFTDLVRTSTGGKTLATYPMFNEWSAEVTVLYNPEKMNRDEVITAITDAGTDKAIGASRPRHGRFNVTHIDGKPVD
jgi:hypothetical protein